MARDLGVSRSGNYAWRTREPTRRAQEEEELVALITRIFESHFKRYGSPRVWQELEQDFGWKVSRKRVERLMRIKELRAKGKRARVKTTDSARPLAVAENLLNRDFSASGPGQKWVSDITYLQTAGGWLYLTVILDLWDRKVIGWNIAEDMRAENVCKALAMAAGNRQAKAGMIFHSDRGVQYCSSLFTEALKRYCPGARQSMSRKGNCWDNACAESFFRTLKGELDILNGRHSKQEVTSEVFQYIEMYYNRRRRHSALGYATPLALSSNAA